MARQIIDIGVEGNDGTGDSIRESFRKSNENFREVYAVIGLGGQITFTSLGDTPDSYDEYVGNNQAAYMPIVKQDGTGIEIRKIVSDTESENATQDTVDSVSIDVTEAGKVILSVANIDISQDQTPTLSAPLNASAKPIGSVEVSEDAVTDYNIVHEPNITIDDLVIDKKYADQHYIQRQVAGDRARIKDEPLDLSAYTITIGSFVGTGYLEVTAHGLDASSNGGAWTYASGGTDATGLTSGTTYYIRVRNEDQLELYASQEDALLDTAAARELVQLTPSGGSGVQTLTDNSYDDALYGNWLSDEALPRKSVVRRQGDNMEGPLYLNDHPGELAGQGTPNGIEDLQAASKYYVDSATRASSTNIFVSTQGNDDQSATPAGLEGRGLSYAYRTVNAAARKAEELQIASKYETGPYMQTITWTNVTTTASNVSGAGIDSPDSDDLVASALVADNIDFIVAETAAWIYYNVNFEETTTTGASNTPVDWTGYVYDEAELEKDLYKIINSTVLDHVANIRANALSIRAGVEYYADLKGKNEKGLAKYNYLAAIERAKLITDYILRNDTLDPYVDSRTGAVQQTIYTQSFDAGNAGVLPNQQDEDSIADNFDIILDIIENGVFAAPKVIDGRRYRVNITNGGSGYVDQGNPDNSDLRVGKVVRGKSSRALGRITRYDYEQDPDTTTPTNNDSIYLELLEPVEFEDGEELEYGNLVRENQVTIFIETGIYYEDYPIRVPNNVSIKGDEFRRCIIRPKNRPSLSPWANVYYYRDRLFDGLTGDSTSITGYPDTNLPTTGTAYYDPLLNLTPGVDDPTGYFGRHYLVDPTRDINIDDNGQLTVTNPGSYENTARLIEKNRTFIQAEIIEWIDAQVLAGAGIWSGFTYDESKFYRNTGFIVDAIVADLRASGRDNILAVQGEYYPSAVTGEEAQTSAAIQQINAFILDVIDNTAIASLSAEDQYVNTHIVKETGVNTPINELFDLMLFAFDVDFNPARNNNELDAFMMNDATILRNITVQGHGGFMCVLDPEGQILTKSPYIQTGSSFSQSINRQAFRGGMLVDAFCGNTPLTVTNVVNEFEIEVEGAPGSGLFIRKPQTPAPFYIDGSRYQVNDIRDYDPKDGILNPTATLILDPTSGPGENGFNSTTYPEPYDITLQTAGNRSQLGNDFTQINDLGYGLLVMNGGLSEMVSMFTYYCHAAYYSYNGSQIRSVAGSNANGNYGLVAEGSDPNEVPDDVTLLNDMVQSAKSFSVDGVVNTTGVITANATATVSQATSDFSATVAFTTSGRKVYLNSISGTLKLDESLIFSDTGDSGASGVPVSIETGFTNEFEQLSLHFYDTEYVPTNKGEFDIIHNISGSDQLARYEIANISKIDGVLVDGYPITSTIYTTASSGVGAEFVIEKSIQNDYTLQISETGSGYSVSDTITVSGAELGGTDVTHDATITVTAVNTDAQLGAIGAITAATVAGTINQTAITPVRSGQVYRANFSTSGAGFSNDGLLDAVLQDEYLNIRSNQNFIFADANDPENLNIRPSTAVNFGEDPEYTYRSISFATNDSVGNDLEGDEIYTAFDATYDYIRLIVNETYATQASITGSGTTMGATIGDTSIAIATIPEIKERTRLNNNSLTPAAGRPEEYTNQLPMLITWGGKKHTVTNYREVILASAPNNISGATQASPVVITTSSTTSIRTGQEVDIASVLGMTELNGNTYYAKQVNTTSFELYSDLNLTTPVDGTGFTAYTSGGTATGNLTETYQFNSDANSYALVDVTDVANSDITGGSTTGLNTPVYILDETVTLRAGLHDGSPATITIDISTCRATGHDFLDIGTGSFNQTNYPNVTLGFPAKSPDQDTEVQERNKGRVFYVSTDQDGFFRVGRFFTVDQGTGTVTFSASIALSDVDGIGFKRGVVVTEFSTDSAMSDNAIDTVPVESAVRAYVNRRLGYDHAGIPINNNIGPKVIVQNGAVPMTGDLDMDFNRITDLADIDLNSDGKVAVNKDYVDEKAEAFNKFSLMRDVSVHDGQANQLIAISGAKTILIDSNTVVGGDFEPGQNLQNAGGGTNFGDIVGVYTYYDSVYGDVIKLSFEPTVDYEGITVNSNVYNSAGGSALVVDGIYDEVINASQNASSDIDITVVRTDNNNTEDPDVDPNFPTASIDLQLKAGVVFNNEVASNAGIVQSKLNLQEADTYTPGVDTLPVVGDDDATVQSTLGLAKFDGDIFDVARGWTTVADNGIQLGKIAQIASDTVLGNSTGSTSNVTAVTFNTVVDEGGGILHTDFASANQGAMIRTGAESYDIELITTNGTADSLVKTEGNGEVTVNSLALGQNNNYTVLQLDGTGGTRLKVTTPVGGTVFTAQGGSASINPDVFIPGNLNIGELTDPDGDDAGTEPDVFDTSILQDNSTSFSTSSWVASEWAYHGFIEAPNEKGAASAGVAIGAGSGKAAAGEVAIVVGNSGNGTSPIVATFKPTGFVADTNNAYDIGEVDTRYNTAFLTTADVDNVVYRSGTETTTLEFATPSVNRTITFQNATGTVALTSDVGALDLDAVTTVGNTTSNDILPSSTGDNVNIGSSGAVFNTVYATTFEGTATNAQYADLAENYLGDTNYEPGTVLVLGGSEEVTVTSTKGDHRVAGIVTTNPAHLMNSALEGDHVVGVALKGRVPCKVIGVVEKGDMLVTSAIPGYAIVNNNPGVGTVIGKAITAKSDSNKGTVEVLVGRT